MSTICLGMSLGLPPLEMAGWGCIYSPQHKYSRWRKAAAFCGTPDSSVVHRTAHCSLSGAPSRCPEQVIVGAAGFPHRTVRSSHRTVRWSSLRVPPGTSRWTMVPWCTEQSSVWAPDSPQAAHLDFSWIFLMYSFEVLLSPIP
jgi:hypothetical protein